ncbi:MAG: hypothetical protein K0S80_5006 [Neobacillus sp.]|jgi:uncharacterized protein YecT (DUF1311 family)|nr:hypothetical protein [Neobacillus sp.]
MCKSLKIYILTIFISSFAFADKIGSVCIPDSRVFNEILNCYLADCKKNNKILNEISQKKISNLSKGNKEKLRESQRDWIKEKEAVCVADENEYGRESHFEAIKCQTEMTKERISFLNKY